MWIHLKHRCVVQISGREVRPFLQGLITQDIFKLREGGCLYSLMLTPKGRFLYDFFLYEWRGEIYLVPEKAVVEPFIRMLSLYTLGRPLVIQEQPGLVVASDLGRAELGRPAVDGLIVSDPRRLSMGRLYVGDMGVLSTLMNDGNAYLAHRINQCVPEGPDDLIPHVSIPLENRLDELNAINWEKGCYVGQELTSRTKHVGEVRKNLFTVDCKNEIPKGEMLLYTTEGGKKEAGILRSRFLNKGLAQIRLEYTRQLPTEFKTADGNHSIVLTQKALRTL